MQSIDYILAVFKNTARVGLEIFTDEASCLARLAHWRQVYEADEAMPVALVDTRIAIQSCWGNRAQRVALLVYTQTEG